MNFKSLPIDAPLRITSKYGERTINGVKENHNGVDLGGDKTKLQTNILAVSAGVVQKNYWNNTRGWVVVVDHGEGYTTLYQHLREAGLKKVGDKVVAGEPIGVMGSTGYSMGVHLHFELLKDNVPIDPTPYLNALVPHDWAKDAWERATAKGIVDGTRPRDKATREEVVTMLGRIGVL